MNKKDVIVILLLVVLLLMNFSMMNKVNNLQNNLSNIQQQYANLQNNISNISSNVSSTMRAIEEEQKWLRFEGQSIEELSIEGKTAKVNLKWSIKELNPEDKVSILYGKYEDNRNKSDASNWKKVQIEVNESLFFEKDIILDIEYNYVFKVKVTRVDGSIIVEDLTGLELQNMMDNRVNVDIEYSLGKDNTGFFMHIFNDFGHFEKFINGVSKNNSFDNNEFKIKNINIVAEENNKIIFNKCVYENGDTLVENLHNESFDNEEAVEIFTYDGQIDIDEEIDINNIIIKVIIEDYYGNTYERKFSDGYSEE